MRGLVFGETVDPYNRVFQKRNRREVESGSYVTEINIFFNIYFISYIHTYIHTVCYNKTGK